MMCAELRKNNWDVSFCPPPQESGSVALGVAMQIVATNMAALLRLQDVFGRVWKFSLRTILESVCLKVVSYVQSRSESVVKGGKKSCTRITTNGDSVLSNWWELNKHNIFICNRLMELWSIVLSVMLLFETAGTSLLDRRTSFLQPRANCRASLHVAWFRRQCRLKLLFWVRCCPT